MAVPEVVDAEALVQDDLEQDLEKRSGKQVPTAKDPIGLGMPTPMTPLEEKITNNEIQEQLIRLLPEAAAHW